LYFNNEELNENETINRSMKKIIIFSIILISLLNNALSQFAPKVGEPGTSAIYKDSSVLLNWAKSCELHLGTKQISLPDSGLVCTGDFNSAIGKAGENGVVSLGDGGYAILTFEKPIVNGQGSDFAVFENSFDGNFLELAFVEVSSDGVNYYRFPSTSLTQDTIQVLSFGTIDAKKINNLAGKYQALYGTPFDLDDLKNEHGLDINNITHVKIIDIIGSIDDDYASYDVLGNKINDPFPTCFPTGGFDLDAVGVINQKTVTTQASDMLVYPNPASNFVIINSFEPQEYNLIRLYNDKGLLVKEIIPTSLYENKIDLSDISLGIYYLSLVNNEGIINSRKIIKL